VGGPSPCSACLLRVLGLHAGESAEGLVQRAVRVPPPVLVVSGVGSRRRVQAVLIPSGPWSRLARSAEGLSGGPGPGPLVQVVVVELRAPGPQVPKPPRCSPGAANRFLELVHGAILSHDGGGRTLLENSLLGFLCTDRDSDKRAQKAYDLAKASGCRYD
jgi:hypothetical protein